MADPLSITSGIAGLITLAEIVLERTYKTIICCKNAGKDAQRLLLEVQSLLGILNGLHVLEKQVSKTTLSTTIPAHLRHQCQKMLESLRDKLGDANPRGKISRLRQTVQTIKWPLASSETEKTLAEIERYKSSFNLAISMDALEAVLETSLEEENLRQDVKSIKDHLCRIELDQEKEDTLSFFGTYDPESNHETSVKLRQPDTCVWLIESQQLQTWFSERGNKLWLHGIPGAGKTVLAGIIIDEALKRASPLIGVAYYYCDYKNPNQREVSSILASIAGQLAVQSKSCFKSLRKVYRPSQLDAPIRSLPDSAALQKLLVRMSSHFDEVLLVIDAIDECNDATEVSQNLCCLIEQSGSKIKLVALSRDEQDIRDHIGHFASMSIAALNSDLRLFVSAQIEERTKSHKLKIRSTGLKDEILEHLINKADGMFRWVVCQMDHLCELPNDAARRKALLSLPPDLNTTYARILERIDSKPEPTKILVERVLAWLLSDHPGVRRLTDRELCSVVAINDGQRIIDKESEPEPEDVLLHCSSLVRRSPDQHIELAHFTVEEYLRNSIPVSDTYLRRYRHAMIPKCLYKFRTCLTILCMDDFARIVPPTRQVLRDRNDQFPAYEFAACCWPKFASDDDLGPIERTILDRLFLWDGAESSIAGNFRNWAETYTLMLTHHGVDVQDMSYFSLTKVFARAHADPLHYACILGRPGLVSSLLNREPDVNKAGVLGTALHCAILPNTLLCSDNEWPEWTDQDWTLQWIDTVDTRSYSRRANTQSIVKMLCAAGASSDLALEALGQHGQSMFWLACMFQCGVIFAQCGQRPDRYALQQILKYSNQFEKGYLKDVISAVDPQVIAEEDRGLYRTVKLHIDHNLGVRETSAVSKIKVKDQDSLSKDIFEVCESDSLTLLKYMHATWEIELLDLRNDTGDSLLEVAVHLGAAEVIEYLVELTGHARMVSDADALGNEGKVGPAPKGLMAAAKSAIQSGNLNLFKFLVENGLKMNDTFTCGCCTSLVLASLYRQSQICAYLLDYGSEMTGFDCPYHGAERHTTLQFVTREPSLVHALKLMLRRPDFPRHLLSEDDTYDQGCALLHIAVEHNNGRALKLLLQHGASVNLRDPDGTTALHIAALRNRRKHAEMLIAFGADCDAMDSRCQTPLHLAAAMGHARIVEMLLVAGANPNLRNDNLHGLASFAVATGHTSILEISTRYTPASFTMNSDVGLLTPLALRGDVGSGSLAYLTSRGLRLDKDKDYESDMRAQFLCSANRSFRCYALNAGHVLMDPSSLYGWTDQGIVPFRKNLKRFFAAEIFKGINAALRTVHRFRSERIRPLHEASIHPSPRISRMLIESGAMPNLESGPEGTPLMAACTYGRMEVVKELVSLGALEYYVKNEVVFSALAKARLFPKIVRWLLVERHIGLRRLHAPTEKTSGLNEINHANCLAGRAEGSKHSFNLDLVFFEDWEDYLESLQPQSIDVYTPLADGGQCEVNSVPRTSMKKCEHCGCRPTDN